MRLLQVGHSYKDTAKHLGIEVGIVGQWWFRESEDFKKQKNTSDKGKHWNQEIFYLLIDEIY